MLYVSSDIKDMYLFQIKEALRNVNEEVLRDVTYK